MVRILLFALAVISAASAAVSAAFAQTPPPPIMSGCTVCQVCAMVHEVISRPGGLCTNCTVAYVHTGVIQGQVAIVTVTQKGSATALIPAPACTAVVHAPPVEGIAFYPPCIALVPPGSTVDVFHF